MTQKQTILHIEDDPDLAELVALTFAGFDRGAKIVHAATLMKGLQTFEERKSSGKPIDLVISDMILPDGSGLDFVRSVRASPSWSDTPIIILSSKTDPMTVGQAYALGANCYLAKQSSDRSIVAVIRDLYCHWLENVVLPSGAGHDIVQEMASRAVRTHSRYADYYREVAQALEADQVESNFWWGRALSESNLANLLAFLWKRLRESDLTPSLIAELKQLQVNLEQDILNAENELRLHPITSADEAYRRALDVLERFEAEPMSRWISVMVEEYPAAILAVYDLYVSNLRGLMQWILDRAADPALRSRARIGLALAERFEGVTQVQ